MVHICYYEVTCELKSWQRNSCFMQLFTAHVLQELEGEPRGGELY